MKDQLYFHGTDIRNIYPIMRTGFKLGESCHGQVNGSGLYIATKPETVAHWSPRSYTTKKNYAIKCRIVPGIKILWKEREYDYPLIKSLEKKFGKEVSRNYDFWKYIPRNKQLTASELRALASHLDYFEGCLGWNRKGEKFRDKKYNHLARFIHMVRGFGYEALGDRTDYCWDSDEILVFNPSNAIPVSAHEIRVKFEADCHTPIRVDYSHPLPLSHLKEVGAKEEENWKEFLAKHDD